MRAIDESPRLELVHRRGAGDARPPLLLLHGAGHGAWAWQPWTEHFAALGYEVFVPSLRGHGGSEGTFRGSRLSDYQADATRVVRTIGRRPVLIGHSLGALLAQRLIAVADFPAAVTVAGVPGRFPASLSIRRLLRHPLATMAENARGELTSMTADDRGVRESFFSPGTPAATVRACAAQLTGIAPHLFVEMTLARPPRLGGTTPLLALAAEHDLLPLRLQRRWAARARAEFVVVAGSGHDIPLDVRSGESAKIVSDWLRRQGC